MAMCTSFSCSLLVLPYDYATGRREESDAHWEPYERRKKRGVLVVEQLLSGQRPHSLATRIAFLAKALYFQQFACLCSLGVLATCFGDETLTPEL